MYSSIAQSVERSAVNRVVVGSSPTRGARPNLYRRFGHISVDEMTSH